MYEDSRVFKYQAKKRNYTPWVIGIIVTVIAVAFGGYMMHKMYYANRFYEGTTFNGIDVSRMTADKAYQKLTAYYVDRRFTLTEVDANVNKKLGTIPLRNAYKIDKAEVEKALTEREKAHSMPVTDAFHSFIISQVNALDLNNGRSTVKDAYITKQKIGNFAIVPEVPGNRFDLAGIAKNVELQISKNEMFLNAADLYIRPKYTTKSKSLINKTATLNGYLQHKATVTLPNKKQLVTPASVVFNAITVKGTVDPAPLIAWLTEQTKAIGTLNRNIPFETATKQRITVYNRVYGWGVDAKTTSEKLAAELINQENYTMTAKIAGSVDNDSKVQFSGNYIEINLDTQTAYMVQYGRVQYDWKIVTGKRTGNNGTTPGTYKIISKQLNATLKGTNDDGTKYASKVNYWMPFSNSGMGIHDSPWQPASAYGNPGAIDTYGSHGCVNTPPAQMSKVYQDALVGMIVVVYGNLYDGYSLSN